jgi:hypothetical protein
VKAFVGTSENALRIQIWTALIALLLLKWLHHLSKANWSLSNLASMLRLNLFTYRSLAQWIDNPIGTPPLMPLAKQLTLPLAWLGQAATIQTGDLDSYNQLRVSKLCVFSKPCLKACVVLDSSDGK